jgi:hypothetical protein
MVKLILIRKYKPDETQGLYLVMDGLTELFRCFCLELPYLNNEHNISCIPEGIYTVLKYSDTKHPNTFWIQNVPDRSGILIHLGNFVNGLKIDSEGCQLPCMSFADIDGNGTFDGMRPDLAMAGLNKFLPDKFKLTIC